MTAPNVEMVGPPDVGKYTKDTKVILSFGSAAGGFQYALALRRAIYVQRFMLDPNTASPGLVYMDTASILTEPHLTWTWNDVIKELTAKNAYWKDLWTGGLLSAGTVIFCVTAAWIESASCQAELELYKAQFAKNNKLVGVFVVFPDAKAKFDSWQLSNKASPISGLFNTRVIRASGGAAPGGATFMFEGHTIPITFNYATSHTETEAIMRCII
jgi:hypothetical protein